MRQLQYAAAMRLSLLALIRSRCLQMVALLAWLAMVSTALFAAPTLAMPCCAAQAHAHGGHAMAAAAHQHAANAVADVGTLAHTACTGHPDMGCTCHDLCGVALLVFPAWVQVAPLTLAEYAVSRDLDTPTPPTAPPLRPPQA